MGDRVVSEASSPAASKRADEYAGRITSYVIVSCIVASSGGLMYGYNIAVSGGVASMDDFLLKFFPDVYSAQRQGVSGSTYCKFNSQVLQAFTSSMYLSGLISTFVASWTTSNLGRRPTMILAGIFFVIGVVLGASAQNLAMLFLSRIAIGFGTGFANQVGPIYLSEIAPARLRGALNTLFQLNVTIGILFANLVSYGTSKIKPWGWRLDLGLSGIPAIILIMGGLVLVETPNSLIERGQLEKGKAVLCRVRGTENVDREFEDLVKASHAAQQVQHPLKNMMRKRNWPQLIISIMLQIFQQFTGINAIMFYAPVIFQALGFKSDASLYSAVITGAVNVVSTGVSVFAVDKFGRRILLLEAGAQMFIAQVVIAFLLGSGLKGSAHLSHPVAIIVVLMLCTFVSAFAWSWGPMGWLIPSEIFPLEARSTGLSIVVFANLLVTFVVAQAFLSMLCALQYGTFLFFAGWVLIMSSFVFLLVPETKNIPLDATVHIWPQHWFWKRIVKEEEEYMHELEGGSNKTAKLDSNAFSGQDKGNGRSQIFEIGE